MTRTEQYFLQAVCAYMEGTTVDWKDEPAKEEWLQLFQLSSRQNVLPMVCEGVYHLASFQESGLEAMIRSKNRELVFQQVMKTQEFFTLYQGLEDRGIRPVVVKGIICRNLFQNPDLRISGDEDLYVSAPEFEACRQAMLDCGMEVASWDEEIVDQHYEISFVKQNSWLRVELHRSLFDDEDVVFQDMSALFDNAYEHTIEVEMDGHSIRTLSYTDHLTFLICHALKHFISSGFGIRQICDITAMANTYGKEIDWQSVLSALKSIHAERFAAAIFKIGEKYLNFDPDQASWPNAWREMQAEEGPLLDDILSGGIYGAADRERLHSSTVTLNAVAAQKQGKSGKASIWKSVFPGAKSLSGRYPYLRTKPFLLPIAWVSRIVSYKKEVDSGKSNSAAESIKIGEQRVELLRQYGILDAER